MEPQLPPVGPSMERSPAPKAESAPQRFDVPEIAPAQTERELNRETSASDARGLAMPSVNPLPVPQPIAVQPPVSEKSSNPVSATAPAVAEDNDKMEKEWVVKAKQVVKNTQTDPHEQERQVGYLKSDYIQKRFNHTIGQSPDQME